VIGEQKSIIQAHLRFARWRLVTGGFMTILDCSIQFRRARLTAIAFSATVLISTYLSTSAHAQVAGCLFDVSRDVVASQTPRPPNFATDGVLITRFALGLRGPALYDTLTRDTNRFVGEGNIGTALASHDVDGDGVFTTDDATIIARYIAGFRDDALVAGLQPNAAAIRRTGLLLTTHMNNGCPQPVVTATLRKHAARLLQQGTYGATLAEIDDVARLGGDANAITSAWLTQQFGKTRSLYGDYAARIIAENKTPAFDWRCSGANKDWGCAYAANTPVFYKFAMEGQDQLRQRVTNALWQTLVVSIANNTILDSGVGLADYWDMISANVFAGNTTDANGAAAGNFRKILKDMTLHPAMGIYLDMLASTKEVANENYARELLQLFSVGTVMLNLNGTPILTGGKTTPSYDESVVQGFAKALTGWHFNNADAEAKLDRYKAWHFYYPPVRDYRKPMTPWSLRRCPQNGRWPPGTADNAPDTNQPAPCYSYCNITIAACSLDVPHNTTDTKKLLQYTPPSGVTIKTTLPAGQSIERDLEDTIDNVFYHPNVGPFISRQLIQRLITSNPTPGYVSRVAAKFNNNGSGIRGDMKAVISQIFLDAEARDVNIAAKNWFGKMREPVNKLVHLHRAFGAKETVEGFYEIWDTSTPETLGQAAMRPPSVFNYYSPDFGPSGPLTYSTTRPLENATFGVRSDEPLLGPEFEITNTSTIAGFSDFWNWGVYGGFRRDFEGNGQSRNLRWTTNYSPYLTGAGALADNPTALIDELDLLLTAGNLKPAFKSKLVDMANGITRANVTEQREQRLQAVMWQIVNSADYAIQR
jgi:uncharacterized protein (DUF1800 family)